MTAAELSLVIKAKDQSAKTFKAMKNHFTRLKANAKKVGQAMNRALGSGLRKTMDLTKKVLIGMAIAIAAVGAAVVKLRNDAKTYILQIDKMTKVTGMSTEEFSKLAYAADQEHASLETLSKSLPILSKYMAYAKDGMATYKREFDKMGITVTDTEGKLKSSYQVLLEMSDYMGRKGANDTEKMAVMMTLLGRRGAEIIPMLKKGSAWFKIMGKEAKGLGIVLDQKTVRAIKKSDDSLTALKKAFLGVGIAIIKAIEPSLERAQNAFKEYTKNARKWIDEHREEIREKLSEAWVKVEGAMKSAWNFMKKMMDSKWRADQFENIRDAFKEMVPYIQGATYAMAGLFVATHLVAAKLALILAGYKLIWEIGHKIGGAGWWVAGKGFGIQAKIMETVVKLQQKLGQTGEHNAELIRMANQARKDELELGEGGIKLMQDKALVIDNLIKALKGELSVNGEIKGAIDKVRDAFTSQLEPLKEGLGITDKQFNKEKDINAILENRKKLSEALQKARAKVPTADFKYTTAAGGQEVVTKEHPAGIPVEQFDKTVAEANALNQTLDDLGKATNGMLGDLITGYKDGTVKIDVLAKGIATYADKANSLSNTQTNVLSQVISVVKNLTNKTNALAKTVTRQALSIKQLAGQGA